MTVRLDQNASGQLENVYSVTWNASRATMNRASLALQIMPTGESLDHTLALCSICN